MDASLSKDPRFYRHFSWDLKRSSDYIHNLADKYDETQDERYLKEINAATFEVISRAKETQETLVPEGTDPVDFINDYHTPRGPGKWVGDQRAPNFSDSDFEDEGPQAKDIGTLRTEE